MPIDDSIVGGGGDAFGQGVNQGINSQGGQGNMFEAQSRLRDWGWEARRAAGIHDRSNRYWQAGMDSVGDWRDRFGQDYRTQMLQGGATATNAMEQAAMARGFSGSALRGAHQASGQMMGGINSGIAQQQGQMDMAAALAQYEQQQLNAQNLMQMAGMRTDIQRAMQGQQQADASIGAAKQEEREAKKRAIVGGAVAAGSMGIGAMTGAM